MAAPVVSPPPVGSDLVVAPAPSSGLAIADLPTPPTAPGGRLDPTIRVMLLEELDEVAARVSKALSDEPDVHLIGTVTDGAEAHERIATSPPDVIVIDALMQGAVPGLRVARELRASGNDTPVVFLTVAQHPVLLTAEMGLAEVVLLPLDQAKLAGAIVRLDHAHRGPVVLPPSGVIGVFSSKGGVGRTTIAHNLAAALALQGVARVALVDGDLVHGDLRLQLGAPDSAPSLMQLPTGHVGESDVEPLLWRAPSGVDVLLAPPRMEQADMVVQHDIDNAMAVLRRLAQVVVVDVPTAMDERTLAFLDAADVVLDVVTPEAGSVHKAQRCRAVLRAADFPVGKMLTVLNRAGSPGLAVQDIVNALAGGPMATIRHDTRLEGGLHPAGSAIVSTHPEVPVSLDLLSLAQQVASRIQPLPTPVQARAA
jgi:pilus assembly protein CpaE